MNDTFTSATAENEADILAHVDLHAALAAGGLDLNNHAVEHISLGTPNGDLAPYVGMVATNTVLNDTIHATNNVSYNKCPHIARDAITALAIVLPNWYSSNVTGDTNGGGVDTWTAAIEYPAGTYTRVTFSGAVSGTVQPGANLVSDFVKVVIPNGAKFWTRIYCVSTGTLLYTSYYQPDGTAQGAYGTSTTAVPDLTMGGNTNYMTGSNTAFRTPVAIIGITSKKTLAIVGDSIAVGTSDVLDGTMAAGYIARAFGNRYAYMNLAIYGSALSQFLSSGAKRSALINSYCSHVITNYGTNDVFSGRTAVQVKADLISFVSQFWTKPTAVCTLLPRTTSTDSWATAANQTVAAQEAVRIVVNATIRNGSITGAVCFYDVERFAESSYMSGKWQFIPGTISPAWAAYTWDGVHPNAQGYAAIAAGIVPSRLM